MKRLMTLPILILMLAAPTPLARAADEMPPHDKQLITLLLDRLKDRKDLHFIREDKTYDSNQAVWYLQYKWDHNKNKVHNVEDFINLSSYGGEHGEITYNVKFADGAVRPAKDVLEESLKKLEADLARK